MRATARLNLLSPAVFPLPFGAKLLPLPPALGEDAQRGRDAEVAQENGGKGSAGHTAITSRVASPPNVADQAKHAQHAKQMSPTATAEAPSPAPRMGLATQNSRHTKRAKHGQPASDLFKSQARDQSGVGSLQKTLMCQGGKGSLGRESLRPGRKPQQSAPGGVTLCNSAQVVGPVTKLVGNSGLVIVPTNESGVQSQSPGK